MVFFAGIFHRRGRKNNTELNSKVFRVKIVKILEWELMEAGGGARGAAADGAVSLDAFFSTLEKELRLHLRAFVAQWAAAGGGAVDEIASHDVRLMVQNLGRRWDDHGAGQAGKTRDLRLEGSPIIAANFYTIHTVLNRYHHKSAPPSCKSFSYLSFQTRLVLDEWNLCFFL
jgi:hypothetical protein